ALRPAGDEGGAGRRTGGSGRGRRLSCGRRPPAVRRQAAQGHEGRAAGRQRPVLRLAAPVRPALAAALAALRRPPGREPRRRGAQGQEGRAAGRRRPVLRLAAPVRPALAAALDALRRPHGREHRRGGADQRRAGGRRVLGGGGTARPEGPGTDRRIPEPGRRHRLIPRGIEAGKGAPVRHGGWKDGPASLSSRPDSAEAAMTAQAPNTFRAGPDERGHFGIYGGRYVAETLMPLILEV